MRTLSLLTLMLALMCGGTARALSRKTGMNAELVSLGRHIQIYQKDKGRYPRTWEEVSASLTDPDLDMAFKHITPTKRMVLLDPPLELPERYGGGVAVAMTRNPFRPAGSKPASFGLRREILREPVYGVIALYQQGGVGMRTIPPSAMESVFRTAGRTPPGPGDAGPFPHEAAFTGRLIVPPGYGGSLVITAVPVALVAWIVSVCLRARERRRGEIRCD